MHVRMTSLIRLRKLGPLQSTFSYYWRWVLLVHIHQHVLIEALVKLSTCFALEKILFVVFLLSRPCKALKGELSSGNPFTFFLFSVVSNHQSLGAGRLWMYIIK